MIEIILAAALFAIIAVTVTVAAVSGNDANRLALENAVATQFASEGLEAVRSIKNQSFSKLSSPGPGLTRTAGTWDFSGSANVFDSRYTRTIAVADVCRDGSGNIINCGSPVDTKTKKATSTVTWNFSAARPMTITLSEYFTNWKAPIISGGSIMMAYSKTTSTPFYRSWDGSSWSAEGSALATGGNINYVVLKSSRTRNEAILGTQDASGAIYIQVWNGTSWGNQTQVGTGNTTTRSFDIEYEKSGDRAMVAYIPSASAVDFDYRIWDGATLSSPSTVSAPPTTGAINWIELAQNPGSSSNEVAIVLLDASAAVYGMAWNGTSWSNMGVSATWDTASTANKKAIDVAYEQNSGRAMFIWGDNVATDQYYRIWNGSTLTGNTLLDIAASGGIGEWVRLVSRPSSDELMYGVQDAGADINTRKWSGSAWDTATQHPEHEASSENIGSMNFDLVWETHSANPGKAWIMYGDGADLTKRQWSGTAWGAKSTMDTGDDTLFVRLKADAASGVIFTGIYEDPASLDKDIWESRLTGGGTTWSVRNIVWGGPTAASPAYFRIDISAP